MDPNETIDQETLDRLVDGELDEIRRREVITALSRADDGWERCALAFLESQSFGHDTRRMVGDDRSADAPGTNAIERARDGNYPANLGWWLTVAASIVFAFALGTRMQSGSTTPERPSPTLTQSLPAGGQPSQLAGHRPADIWRGESMVPSDIETMLNRLGHRVDRQKGFVPMLSADGNRVLVPYEDVRIQPASVAPQ